MKGIVFREFIDHVASQYGEDIVDEIIEAANIPSHGAYTSVGTYDYQELLKLVTELSNRQGIPIATLTQNFGRYLATDVFSTKFPDFFSEVSNTIELLKKVEEHIHVEVRKLYPDAELPKFTFVSQNGNQYEFAYQSSRELADLAHGLICGSSEIYNENIDIERQESTKEGIKTTIFILTCVE